MGNFRAIHLLMLCTVGQIMMTLLYAVQTVRGAGIWMVLGVLILLALSLATLTLGVWKRAHRHTYVYREEPISRQRLRRAAARSHSASR